MAVTYVNPEHIAINAISGTIIADNAITAVHIAQNAILTQHIDDGQVGTSQLAADAVTGAKLADSSVVTANIQDDQVTGDKLANNITIAGTLTSTGVLTANAGVVVDNITIDGTEIDLSSGDLTIDVAGDIILDADGGDIKFQDAGTEKMRLSGNNLHLNGGTDARIQLNSGGAGANTVSNDTVHIRGDGDDMKLMAAADGNYIFEVNGTEAMRIASSGNVGIGTASPVEKLHLGGTAPGDSIIRQDATSSGTNWEIGERAAGKYQFWEDDGDNVRLTIMSSGNVGIGTESPDYNLEVEFTVSNHTTGMSITNSQAGGYGSALNFVSERSDNNAHVAAASIRTQGQDSWNSAASADSNLFFATSTNGSLTDKLTIMSDGRGLSPFTAKVWVNFAGTDTSNVRASHNVSSVDDEATGRYTVNFANNLANDNYAVAVSGAEGGSVSGANQLGVLGRGDSIWAVGSIEIQGRHLNDSAVDNAYMTCIVFGD